jgi:alpha-L-arabinofuranosidase
MAEMPAYIQDVLDLIEWANGPATSKWGAKRAEAGHPDPFHLEYIGIGNEDKFTPEFKTRFKMIQDAILAKHPEITVIGTVGSQPDGENFDQAWEYAREVNTPMVDEHYYRPPEWFRGNLKRYDSYDRNGPKIYAGEYAAQEINRVNTLRTALAEAFYMTGLERNGDVVCLASYAPLLAKQGHKQWSPDMIYFDNTRIMRSANYYVQQMFGQNQGDVYLPTTVAAPETDVAASCVSDTKSSDLILKLVNVSTNTMQAKVNLAGIAKVQSAATRIVLAGEPGANNTFENPNAVVPRTDSFTAAD